LLVSGVRLAPGQPSSARDVASARGCSDLRTGFVLRDEACRHLRPRALCRSVRAVPEHDAGSPAPGTRPPPARDPPQYEPCAYLGTTGRQQRQGGRPRSTRQRAAAAARGRGLTAVPGSATGAADACPSAPSGSTLQAVQQIGSASAAFRPLLCRSARYRGTTSPSGRPGANEPGANEVARDIDYWK